MLGKESWASAQKALQTRIFLTIAEPAWILFSSSDSQGAWAVTACTCMWSHEAVLCLCPREGDATTTAPHPLNKQGCAASCAQRDAQSSPGVSLFSEMQASSLILAAKSES